MTMARHRCRSAALGAALATTLGALPTLYALAVRSMLRRNLGRLWASDPGPLLDSYADNVHFAVPGALLMGGRPPGQGRGRAVASAVRAGRPAV
jgi:hypothetical protein